MTRGAQHGDRSFDPDATVALPILPSSAETDGAHTVEYDASPTVLLPIVTPATAAPNPADPGEPTVAPVPDAPDAPAEAAPSVARSSAVMAAGSIVSRVTGFLRTAAIGAAIGAAVVADDYTLAITLPNMVYELLLGGVLTSVIVPVLVRARRSDPDHGEAYTQRLLSLATIFLAGATVLAVTAAPLLTAVMANKNTAAADRDLITTLGRLILPAIFFYGMAALFGAVLNTRGHFAAPMWAPILNNLVVIVTAGVFALLPSATDLTAESLSAAQILVLGVGTTLGIAVQACGLLPALRKIRFRWRWRWDFRKLHLGHLARLGAWMLLYVVVSQLGVLVLFKIAKLAGDSADAPGPAIYNNAFLIFMMAHGIVAVSIMTALMPRMSAAAADRRHADIAAQLSLGSRLASVILVPATAGYLVLGVPLAVTIFQFGAYKAPQAIDTGWVIAVAGLGLVPFAISQLQLAAFYALQDTRVAALVNVAVVGLRVLVQIVAWLVLPPSLVVAGLMAGNAVSYVFGLVLGNWLLRRRIGRLGMRPVARTLLLLSAATAVGTAPAALVVFGLHRLLGDDKLGSFVQLVVGGLILLAGFVATAVALRIREVTELGAMLQARLGRSHSLVHR